MRANRRAKEALGDARPAELTRAFEDARAGTLALFDLVRDEAALHRSPGFGFRPLVWHLAHVGVFEGYWLLQKLRGEAPPDTRYERLFDPIRTPREGSKDLPSRREMEAYLARVRARALGVVGETDFDESNPLLRDGYVFRLVLEHELQHQETLCYLLHLLDPSDKVQPQERANAASSFDRAGPVVGADDAVLVPEGGCIVGAVGDSFAYDNERPAHEVFVPAFGIDKVLVTNEEYARFVEEGGYRRREWWGEEGWNWRERENWECPLYWRRDGGRWLRRVMFGEEPLPPRHPVTGISWYEAEAYARFAGKRLPTEFEWEKAASWDESGQRKRRFAWGDAEPDASRCNFDRNSWGTTPIGNFPAGASPYGCLDMTGSVWEWTSSPFAGYPGFEAFPYPE